MSAEFWMNLQMIYDLGNAKALPAKVKKSIEENSSVRA
jgi:plasmid maintenance system antidote protein VapI